jgi:hypothetical protein
MLMTVREICAGLPEQLRQIYLYIKGLTFEETPEYEFI